MAYRIIALDLDGTLLTDNKQILPESLETLAQARRQGAEVIIVTGRHHVAIRPFYHQLQLTTPAICCNGTYLYDFHQQHVIKSNPLNKQQAKRIVEILENNHIHSLMYIDNAMVYEQPNLNIERWHLWSNRLPQEHQANIVQVDSFLTTADQAQYVWKFATTADNNTILYQLSELLEQEMPLACEFSWHNQMDITQSGNSKGNMLKSWVESQDYSMQDVIAFGDNFNDISMLEMAGFGVAMKNSTEEIKERANLVTTNNESPGISQIIQQYVLTD